MQSRLQGATNARAAALYDRVRHVIPTIEWPAFEEDIDAILALKHERNAIILAHNYRTPEIFRCVGDSWHWSARRQELKPRPSFLPA